jgi:hypothetical protein
MSATSIERFEVVAALYYRDTGFLRPGKSEPVGSYRDPNSDENRERFEQWVATRAFTSAIDRIVFLENAIPDAP